jgi:putative transcriptional regulator
MTKSKKVNFTYPIESHCKIGTSKGSRCEPEVEYNADPAKSLVQALERFRLENRIPQEELARSLNVAFSTVNRWINGKTKPNKTQCYHIEKLLRGKA